MFSTTDTIVAIATPPGRGGIGVVRFSGPDAHAMARALMVQPEPLLARQHRVEMFRVEIAVVDFVTPGSERIDNTAVKCRCKARGNRMRVEDEESHAALREHTFGGTPVW